MATWQLDLYDRIGSTLVQADLPFRRLTARWVLNGPGALEADFRRDDDLGGLVLGANELHLKRDGTTVWAGLALDADVNPDEHGDKAVKITADGLWCHLADRIVRSDLIYTGVNQQQIAWNLIAHTQSQTNGALGFVQGTHTGANVARDRYYCASERPNIRDAIEDFTSFDDGFDFELDPATRAFNTWSPQRKTALGITLDGTVLDTMPYTASARDLRTYITGIGNNDCGPILQEASDLTLAGTYGRREASIDTQTDTASEVQAEANEELRSSKRVRHDMTITFRDGRAGTPAWGTYHPGDVLTVTDDRGFATYTKLLRISEIAVHLDNATPTVAHVDLVLSSAVD